jgi:CRP-like cAMP-binding protein
MFRRNTPQRNKLLAAFPARSQERLFPHLSLVHFPAGKILHESGHTLQFVYFPVDSIVSLLHVTDSGAVVEMSLTGYEGLVGTEVFMGVQNAASSALVQSAGYAYRLSAIQLRDEFETTSDLRTLLLLYMQASIAQTAQTAACTRHHSIDQQLCRWLLLFLDRALNNRVAMTQDTIAKLLSVSRESVSVAAGKLQNLGVIEYKRGQVTVLDRPELEKRSCECYATVKRETDRLQAWRTSPQVA